MRTFVSAVCRIADALEQLVLLTQESSVREMVNSNKIAESHANVREAVKEVHRLLTAQRETQASVDRLLAAITLANTTTPMQQH